MIEHLVAHRSKGDRVPESALEELRQEAEPDVHVDEELEGLFTCRDCPRGNQFALVTAAEMLEHVLEHRARGANVLDETIDALRDATVRA
jgi:2-polyprenyl-3-methyl-5-hydroxy-6-metoxy-1,4-benzoquinol methylase